LHKALSYFGFLLLVGYACNKSGTSSAIVAKVGDKELTWLEVTDIVPDNSQPKDSAILAESYIRDWIKEQVVLITAEENLAEERQNFDVLIEEYKKSLLTYTYEQELVKQKLDTNIREEEVVNYYKSNEGNFELKDFILKVKYCAIASDSKNIGAMQKLFYSLKPEDIVKWEKFCVDIGASYYFQEDEWIMWDEFVKNIPLEVYDVESFLRKNKSVEFEKNNNLYLITFTDYQLSGSKSPLSFERDRIKNMILNKRKTELLSVMREDLYNKAIENKKVETYYPKQ
jgi:hypothetical protein